MTPHFRLLFAQAARWTLLASLIGPAAHAASDSEVQLVYETVRSKYPEFSVYCKLPEDERRKAAVQITMALAGAKKLKDPFVAGSQAGGLLRRDCGFESKTEDIGKLRWIISGKPLVFDASRQTLGMFTSASSLSNRIFTPTGPGPFPAVVLNHTIGGISQHLLIQAKALIEAGFAVLVVDSYGPRNLQPGAILAPAELARDAYDALSLLDRQEFIDKQRIFQSGYSLGAYAAALLASPEGAPVFKQDRRFRATVAHYGGCTLDNRLSALKMEMLSADSDRPILMLMAELDIETPPASCFPLLEQMKAAGKDVQWHIYPKTTHGWDKAENNGYVYRTTSGDTMTYRYDEAVAKDATERMLAFFNRFK